MGSSFLSIRMKDEEIKLITFWWKKKSEPGVISRQLISPFLGMVINRFHNMRRTYRITSYATHIGVGFWYSRAGPSYSSHHLTHVYRFIGTLLAGNPFPKSIDIHRYYFILFYVTGNKYKYRNAIVTEIFAVSTWLNLQALTFLHFYKK